MLHYIEKILLLSNIRKMSSHVVSDIQTRAEGEGLQCSPQDFFKGWQNSLKYNPLF